MTSPTEVGPTEVGPTEVGPTEVGPTEADRERSSRERARRASRFGLGLWARGTVAFAALALVLSAALALLTYQFARSYLLDQRDSLAVRQAVVNAQAAREVLRAREPDVPALLRSFPDTSGSLPVLRAGEQWYSLAVTPGRDALPAAVVESAERGVATRQRFELAGEPAIAVGVPLPAVDAAYFELFPMRELHRTLSTLRWSLFAAATITTILGAAVGAYASRRVLRPVRTFAVAASDLAEGRLDTRLAAQGDRDLAPIAATFNEMAAALQDRIEREARFASDVTHELRTPLTALSAAVDVLERRSDERSQPAIDVLRAQVRHFERLVLDLLEVSRFDAGAAELHVEVVDPVAFVTAAVERLGFDPVPVAVVAGTPERFPLDKRRVERMLANLLENAARYGGGAVRVELAANGDDLRIAVEDAGPGVPVAEREQVFERFHRSAASAAADEAKGTGLGLALVAEHAALHGGRAWVEPRAGGGARFVVELGRGGR